MPSVQIARDGIATLPKGPPLVVALIGGTTGIGSYVARTLADTYAKAGDRLRVYIIGRRIDRAETVLKYGRDTSPGSDWRFIQVTDLSLMSEVDSVSREIISQEEAQPFAGGPPRLDVLYMSQAKSPLQPSAPTKEGIDAQMSLLYYSRMRFIQSLTPLLTASPDTAHVISIFAGNMEDRIPAGTQPIGTPRPEIYGITPVRIHATFMKTFFFEELAEKHAGKISFVHVYPGLVDGPTFYTDVNPLWFRILWRVVKPLMSWYMTSPEVCGQIMLFLATERYTAKGTVKPGDEDKAIGGVAFSTQRELGGGAYAVGQRGDERKEVRYLKIRNDDTAKKVWDHTTSVLRIGEKMTSY